MIKFKKRTGAALVETAATMLWFMLVIFCCMDLVRYGYYNAEAQTAVQKALEREILNPLVVNEDQTVVNINKDLYIGRTQNMLKALAGEGINLPVPYDSLGNPSTEYLSFFKEAGTKSYYALRHVPYINPPAPPIVADGSGCKGVATFDGIDIPEPERPFLVACVQYPIKIFFGSISVDITAYAIGRSE